MPLYALRDEDHEALDLLETRDAGRAQVQPPGTTPDDHPTGGISLDFAVMLRPFEDATALGDPKAHAELRHALGLLDARVRAFAGLLAALDHDARDAPPPDLFTPAGGATGDAIGATAWSTAGARILTAASVGAAPGGGIAALLGVEPSTEEPGGGCWPPGLERPLALPVQAAAVPWLDGHAERWRDCLALGRDEEARARVHARALVAAVWPCGPDHRRDLLLALRGGREEVGDLARCASLAEEPRPQPAFDRWIGEIEGRDVNAGATPNAAAPPSPLHRWTWQRIALFAVFLALSWWMYALDK